MLPTTDHHTTHDGTTIKVKRNNIERQNNDYGRSNRRYIKERGRIAHNNVLWRKLKATRHTYFEGGVDAYRRFMSVNTLSPTVYLTKNQLSNNISLLLPRMAVSSGPAHPIEYQLGEVDNQPALLTDLTPKDICKGEYLLYVLRQEVMHWQN